MVIKDGGGANALAQKVSECQQTLWRKIEGGDMGAAQKWLQAGLELSCGAAGLECDTQALENRAHATETWLKVLRGCSETMLKIPTARRCGPEAEVLARLLLASDDAAVVHPDMGEIQDHVLADGTLLSALAHRLETQDDQDIFVVCLLSAAGHRITRLAIQNALSKATLSIARVDEDLQSTRAPTAACDLSPAILLVRCFVRNLHCRRVMESGCEEAQELVSSLLQAITSTCTSLHDTNQEQQTSRQNALATAAAGCMEAVSHLVSSGVTRPEVSMGLWQHAVTSAVRSLSHSNSKLSSSAASLLSSFARARPPSSCFHPGRETSTPAEGVLRLQRELRRQRERHEEEVRAVEAGQWEVQEVLASQLSSLRAKLADSHQRIEMHTGPLKMARITAVKFVNLAEASAKQQQELEHVTEQLREAEEERDRAGERVEELEGRLAEEQEERGRVEARLREEEEGAAELRRTAASLQSTLEEREQRVDTLSRKLCMLAGSHKDQAALIAKQNQQLRASKTVTSAIQKLASGLSIEAS